MQKISKGADNMNRGRPRKKPNVDTAKEIAEMVKEACDRMQEPFDDRTDRDPDLPSMNEVAREMDVTIIKLKRLLITGGYYSSATSRDVQRLVKAGKGTEEICETLNIHPATYYSCIPYSKGAYNLKEPSLCADQNARSRKRKKAVAELQEKIERGSEADQKLALWKCICLFSNYPFSTAGRKTKDGGKGGIRFRYTVSSPGGSGGRHYDGESVEGFGNEMWISTAGGDKKKSISRSTVDLAFARALELGGVVSGPRALNIPGAHSYLYPIFVRFRVITEQG